MRKGNSIFRCSIFLFALVSVCFGICCCDISDTSLLKLFQKEVPSWGDSSLVHLDIRDPICILGPQMQRSAHSHENARTVAASVLRSVCHAAADTLLVHEWQHVLDLSHGVLLKQNSS